MAKPVFENSEVYRFTDLKGRQWGMIGRCCGEREIWMPIYDFLAKAGIESILEGSIMFSISVLEADIQKALDKLKDYEDTSGYSIYLYVA